MTKSGNILLINTSKKECGIHQYGLNVFKALEENQNKLYFNYFYGAPVSKQEFIVMIQQRDYTAIIINYVGAVMPWLKTFNPRQYKNTFFIDLIHEGTHLNHKNSFVDYYFDFTLYASPLDRNETNVFKLPRVLPKGTIYNRLPEKIRVGSFGFGILDRGWLQVIEKVQKEFDEANIVFQMPFNSVVDPNGLHYALNTAHLCKQVKLKPDITLTISHNFLEPYEVVNWLSGNTINLFLYQEQNSKGISSTIDFALASKRPIGISSSPMFKHLSDVEPLINADKNKIVDIIQRGPSILDNYRNIWSSTSFSNYLDSMLRSKL